MEGKIVGRLVGQQGPVIVRDRDLVRMGDVQREGEGVRQRRDPMALLCRGPLQPLSYKAVGLMRQKSGYHA